MCGWQTELSLVTHGLYLSTLEILHDNMLYKFTYTIPTLKRSVIDDDDMIIRRADLCICLGTSLQIFPCANLPLLTKKSGGRIAIVNLQVTRLESRADLVVHERVDRVMNKVVQF